MYRSPPSDSCLSSDSLPSALCLCHYSSRSTLLHPTHQIWLIRYARDWYCELAPLNVSYVWQDYTCDLVIFLVILYIRLPSFLIRLVFRERLAIPSKTTYPSTLILQTWRTSVLGIDWQPLLARLDASFLGLWWDWHYETVTQNISNIWQDRTSDSVMLLVILYIQQP